MERVEENSVDPSRPLRQKLYGLLNIQSVDEYVKSDMTFEKVTTNAQKPRIKLTDTVKLSVKDRQQIVLTEIVGEDMAKKIA